MCVLQGAGCWLTARPSSPASGLPATPRKGIGKQPAGPVPLFLGERGEAGRGAGGWLWAALPGVKRVQSFAEGSTGGYCIKHGWNTWLLREGLCPPGLW